MKMLRKSLKTPAVMVVGTILLAACQPGYNNGTYGNGVYVPSASAGDRIYRTSDGRVFRTRAERDAYLRALERERAQEVYDQQLRRDRVRQRRAEILAAERAAERRARRDARLERQRRIEAKAERDRLRAEQDRRRADRAARQAEREARRAQRDGIRGVQTGRDPDLAAREARRVERQARREAERARREQERLGREDRLARQEARARRAAARSALGRGSYYRPKFVYQVANDRQTEAEQRYSFYYRNHSPGETEAEFWARPVR